MLLENTVDSSGEFLWAFIRRHNDAHQRVGHAMHSTLTVVDLVIAARFETVRVEYPNSVTKFKYPLIESRNAIERRF